MYIQEFTEINCACYLLCLFVEAETSETAHKKAEPSVSKPGARQSKSRVEEMKESKSNNAKQTKQNSTPEKVKPDKKVYSSPVKSVSVHKDKETSKPTASSSKKRTSEARDKKTPLSSDSEEEFNPKKARKRSKAVDETTPKRAAKKPSNDSPAPKETPDDDKKKAQRANYMKFLSRQNARPKNLGSKEVPIGAPNCLAGKTFVLSGILDSLERGDVEDIVSKYGGRVTSAVSGKTTHLIIGEDPGESKTKKAKSLQVPLISEDDFLEMIRASNPNQESNEPMDLEEEEMKDENHNESLFESSILTTPVKEKSSSLKSPISSPVTRKSSRKTPVKDDPSPKNDKDTKTAKEAIKVNVKKEMDCTPPDPLVIAPIPGATKTSLMWVDKYKPKDLKDVVGQAGESSNARKLVRWLQNWFKYHGSSGEKVKAGWGAAFRDPEGKTFKCALLSGPPGIGKTTSAHLACKLVGYHYFELNASDTRNKKGLHERVADALSSKCIVLGNAKTKDELSGKHVLIMDEVDGMSGNEDRGGVQELIALIKTSRVPLICICNDRNHEKIRSLANYCFDLRFSKPRNEQLKSFISKICFRENIKMQPDKMQKLIISSDQDVRQIIHQLELYKDSGAEGVLDPKKDLKFGPWDVIRKVFSKQEHRAMSIHDKISLFFQDYSLGPLFVQENYLKWTPEDAGGNKQKILDRVKASAEAIADGDLVENLLRRSMNWSLLPLQAIYSSYIPGEFMAGNNGGVEFPAWLGKNSNKNKRSRLLQQLHTHVHLSVSGSLEALNMEYLPYLRRSIVNPLACGEVTEAADKMQVSLNYFVRIYFGRRISA